MGRFCRLSSLGGSPSLRCNALDSRPLPPRRRISSRLTAAHSRIPAFPWNYRYGYRSALPRMEWRAHYHPGVRPQGRLRFLPARKDPDDQSDGPKMLSSRGSHVDLYGWELLRLRPKRVIICEGEFDRLVLEAHEFQAVTSTGGAGTFRHEWAEAIEPIPEVYICFD